MTNQSSSTTSWGTTANGLRLSGTISADNNNLWYYSTSNNQQYFHFGPISENGTNAAWLQVENNKASVGNSTNNRVNTITANSDGTFYIRSGNYYLNRYGGSNSTTAAGYGRSNNSNTGAVSGSKWKLYEVTSTAAEPVTLSVGPSISVVQPKLTTNLTTVVSVNGNSATNYNITWTSSDNSIATVNNGVVTGVKDGSVDITATLTKANGTDLQNPISVTVKVTVESKEVLDIELLGTEGEVIRGSKVTDKTGTRIKVSYDDGSTEIIDVTVNMLSGIYDLNKSGTYTGLTVTYLGKTETGYTLHVTNVVGNDYPEYPDEGAVRVNKTGQGQDFQASGITKIELSTTGIPYKKGVDVVVILDTSSSMQEQITDSNGQKTTRLSVMRKSLVNFFADINKPMENGEQQDIRVAIAKFNGYTSPKDYLNNDTGYMNSTTGYGDNSEILTSNFNGVIADGFVDASALKDYDSEQKVAQFIRGQKYSTRYSDNFGYMGISAGTNYDKGLELAYQLGNDIKEYNEAAGEERELYVIFMSDGAPFQYNYFTSKSGNDDWNKWLTGDDTVKNSITTPNEHFYNGDGNYNRHFVAEAIKGDSTMKYSVIDKSIGGNYMKEVTGLDGVIYSIGFCLAEDEDILEDSMHHVLKGIATDESYYKEATNSESLNNAFAEIGSSILEAATDAYFVDTMGEYYDIQLGTVTYKPTPTAADKTIVPEINVVAYDIYTKANVGTTVNGIYVTEAMVGKRTGTSKTLETVTFNSEGTAAYTGNNKTNNILKNGVICANTFWYNTNSSAVMIDTDGDGKTDYNLAPETFYWKVGTIKQTELAINYYAYLTESREGNREAGSYPTNTSATLHYTNWLGNNAHKDTISPVHAWQGANVSYAFYLVNDAGEVIVNQTTGETGTFANRIAVTQPVIYKEIFLNSGDDVEAMKIVSTEEGLLPQGYTLYDSAAIYDVKVNSNGGGSWEIIKGNNLVNSTYVTGFSGAEYSNEQSNSDDAGYDYTHTTVWFAVKWEIKTIPDVVVIDYGLPVDISVLGNDMFGQNGKLAAVGTTIPSGTFTDRLDASNYKETLNTVYGKATVNGDKVRYALNTSNGMEMKEAENFAYAVNYTGSTNSGYYYGDVTVIPATKIYYEDNFLTLGVYDMNHNKLNEEWITVGRTNNSATQDEDRPGKYSLPEIDANNVYGYDSAYKEMSQYSLDSAKMVNVNADKYGKAEFTFYGTGFDIIALTSNKTGTITVSVNKTVTAADGTTTTERVKNLVVDTYYGYKYENGEWIVDTTNKDNALYQVPVMKVVDLPYGKYDVTIKAAYNTFFDHEQYEDSYDLYLDAIRIYDPAGVTTGDNGVDTDKKEITDAYIADTEAYPEYFEVRNQLIDAGTFGSLANDDVASGIIFIDGKDGSQGLVPTIDDYKNYGPNNELYLNQKQAVAFYLNLNNLYDQATIEKITDVQIGFKSVGGTAKVKVYDSVISKAANVPVQEIKTATDMYYSIKDIKDGVIAIYNAGDEGDAMVSVTNIKITFEEMPVKKADSPQTMSVFGMSRMTANYALRSLAAEEPDTPEVPNTPEVPDTPEEPDTPGRPSALENLVQSVVKLVKSVLNIFKWF